MGLPPILKILAVFISLLAIASSFRYFVHYWGLLQKEPAHASQHLARYRGAGVVLAVSGLVFIALLASLVSDAKSGIPMIVFPVRTLTPDNLLTPAGSTASPTPLLPATPTLSDVSPTPTLITQLARIGNTGTFGVNVRASPSLQGEIIANLPDDTQVFLLSESLEADGFLWRHISFLNNLEGWVANNFLIAEQ